MKTAFFEFPTYSKKCNLSSAAIFQILGGNKITERQFDKRWNVLISRRIVLSSGARGWYARYPYTGYGSNSGEFKPI